jgi:hypothetical protein
VSPQNRRARTLCRFGSLCGAVASFIWAGCVSADLSKNADIGAEVIESLPTDAPHPSMVARAIWFPNSSGFGSTDSSPLGHVSGVLALSGNSLYFMTWNAAEHHFDVAHVVALLPARAIKVERMGPSAMLVVESRNLSFDGYELSGGAQIGSDAKSTQELYEKIEALRPKDAPP